MDVVKEISTLIANQFPDVYKDEGQNLIQFVKAYYEWLETSGQVVGDSRQALANIDIDTTVDSFISHFVSTYMDTVPANLLADKRLLQKHVTEIYRSKGSPEGLKLLFRLLYNEEIDIYIPSYDILKASDGKWVGKKYVEIEYTPFVFTGHLITGHSSRATAIVESHETRIYNGKPINLLYLSHISGDFVDDEIVTYEGIEIENSPRILGSPAIITIQTSQIGFSKGLLLSANNGSGIGLTARTASLFSVSNGFINFSLEFGGSEYSMNAVITITPQGAGSGADFEIGSLTNTFTYNYNTDAISPYVAVGLDDVIYAYGGGDTSGMANANISTALIDALTYETKTVGTIETINILSPGDGNYDDEVAVTIVDPYTGANDAIVLGPAIHGSGLVGELHIATSGFGYMNNELLTLVNPANSAQYVTGRVGLGGLGIESGYWKNTDGFLNADKYLEDSNYYQEFSYEVRSSHTLSQYADLLKKVFHPVGNKMFGRFTSTSIDITEIELVEIGLSQVERVGQPFGFLLTLTRTA